MVDNLITDTARIVQSRSGTRIHALARPVPMSVTYGRWGTPWADTLCGRSVDGLAWSDDTGSTDARYARRVNCQQCVRKIRTDGPPIAHGQTTAHADWEYPDPDDHRYARVLLSGH